MIITSPDPQDIIGLFVAPRYDAHVGDWRWHTKMVNSNPNYLADIAARQADKRAAGIGTEGLCHA